MNNLILLPILIPLLTGLVILFSPFKRNIAIITLQLTGILTLFLAYKSTQHMLVINFGGWAPPYGIQFAGDFLSLMLCAVSLILTSLILIYGRHRSEAHNVKLSFILFLLVGVNGSFLTADMFNLFVMFEVMLLSSFVLLAIGNQSRQLKASIPYVVINIVGSWLFLIAIALTYRFYGTLNFAHLAERIQSPGHANESLLVAVLFLIVFSLKSALLLFMWLPKSYSVLSTEIAALFSALLTKVGVYSIIRLFSVVFVIDDVFHIIYYMSILTMLIGSIGVLVYKDIKHMICYQIIQSIGIVIFAISFNQPQGFDGAIFYLFNDMLAKGLLFLVCGTIIYRIGIKNISRKHGLLKTYPTLAVLLFLVSLTITGVPPFGGFMGKLLILESALSKQDLFGAAAVILTSLISLYALIRLFIQVFMGESHHVEKKLIFRHQYVAMFGILFLSICISIFAQPLWEWIETIHQGYADTLLQGGR